MKRTKPGFREPERSAGIFLSVGLLFAFLAAALVFFSADASAASWIKVNTSGVIINTTYDEKVDLVQARIISENNKVYELDTSPTQDTKTFISRTRTQLPSGVYTFKIKVADRVGNTRNDSKQFEIDIPPPPGCGDGVVSGAEECDDGNNLDGDGCSKYCKIEVCGNGIIDAGEECDSSDLNGMSCTTIGNYLGGSLTCSEECLFDYSGCSPASSEGYCGDNILNGLDESCDDGQWGNITKCSDFAAFSGGSLFCGDNCHFNTEYCAVTTGVVNDSCYDNSLSGDESDVDCGGSCPPCNDGKACFEHADCISNNCVDNICQGADCDDNEKNGLESDVDCGGDCPKCELGKMCNIDSDCVTGFCNSDTGLCAEPSCDDGFKNGDETGVDCGGGCAEKCGAGEGCLTDQDCEQGYVCKSGSCTTDKEQDSDNDGMPDWWENRNGLDPNDPTDAGEDLDGDGYTNLEEYQMGTDPTNPNDPMPEKSHTFQTILLILGLLLMLGGAGFLVYSKKYMAQPAQSQMRAGPARQPPGQMQKRMPGRPGRPRPGQRPRFKHRPSRRSSLLDRFADKGQEQPGKDKPDESGRGSQKNRPEKAPDEYVALSDLNSKKQGAKAKPEAKTKQESEAFKKLGSLGKKDKQGDVKDSLKKLSEDYDAKKKSKTKDSKKE